MVKDLEIFALYDSKVGTWRLPTYQMSQWDVIRQLEALFRDQSQSSADIVQNCADFTLFRLGDFNRRQGKFFIYDAPESIVNLLELKASLKPATATPQQ